MRFLCFSFLLFGACDSSSSASPDLAAQVDLATSSDGGATDLRFNVDAALAECLAMNDICVDIHGTGLYCDDSVPLKGDCMVPHGVCCVPNACATGGGACAGLPDAGCGGGGFHELPIACTNSLVCCKHN